MLEPGVLVVVKNPENWVFWESPDFRNRNNIKLGLESGPMMILQSLPSIGDGDPRPCGEVMAAAMYQVLTASGLVGWINACAIPREVMYNSTISWDGFQQTEKEPDVNEFQ